MPQCSELPWGKILTSIHETAAGLRKHELISWKCKAEDSRTVTLQKTSETIPVFRKTYSSESLCDLGRDIEEAVDPAFNGALAAAPGFLQSSGSFIVTIDWAPVS